MAHGHTHTHTHTHIYIYIYGFVVSVLFWFVLLWFVYWLLDVRSRFVWSCFPHPLQQYQNCPFACEIIPNDKVKIDRYQTTPTHNKLGTVCICLGIYWMENRYSFQWTSLLLIQSCTLIARFMWPTWGPSGADRTQVGPMLAPWTLLSGQCVGNGVSLGCISHRYENILSYQLFTLTFIHKNTRLQKRTHFQWLAMPPYCSYTPTFINY